MLLLSVLTWRILRNLKLDTHVKKIRGPQNLAKRETLRRATAYLISIKFTSFYVIFLA